VACTLQLRSPRVDRRVSKFLSMAQETVERLLGRILTDADFRRRFFDQGRDQLQQFDLLEHERDCLTKLGPDVMEKMEHLSEKLDPRIVRG
jgi:hypothetical protein